jgi:hypothetical protein
LRGRIRHGLSVQERRFGPGRSVVHGLRSPRGWESKSRPVGPAGSRGLRGDQDRPKAAFTLGVNR